jgi:CheY-like chemotaxis protein
MFQASVLPPRKSHPAPLRVLLADDNKACAESFCLLIRRWGHDCRVAYDGLEALDLAAECPPDVALLDIDLPGMDGCEVARRLREVPGLETVVLIAVTGHADEAHRRECYDAGFEWYLVKPTEPSELRTLLRALTHRKRKRVAG